MFGVWLFIAELLPACGWWVCLWMVLVEFACFALVVWLVTFVGILVSVVGVMRWVVWFGLVVLGYLCLT